MQHSKMFKNGKQISGYQRLRMEDGSVLTFLRTFCILTINVNILVLILYYILTDIAIERKYVNDM